MGNQKSNSRGVIRLRAVSLFSWSVEQNARDTQMTTRVTEGARRERLPPSFLVSRGFAAQRWRARALPLLNLKKKSDCSLYGVIGALWHHHEGHGKLHQQNTWKSPHT